MPAFVEATMSHRTIRTIIRLGAAALVAFAPLAVARAQSARDSRAPANTDEATARELMRLEDAWGAAQMRRDGGAVGRMLMGDFAFTGPDGSRLTKAQLVVDIIGSRTVYVAGANSEYRVRAHGGAAVITGLWTATVRTAKGVEVRRYRWTDTWIKQADGRWLCLAGQSMLVH